MPSAKEVARDMVPMGSAIGFIAAGETVCARRSAGQKRWRAWVQTETGPRLTDPRIRNFPGKAEAAAYAASLIDEARTEELRWW